METSDGIQTPDELEKQKKGPDCELSGGDTSTPLSDSLECSLDTDCNRADNFEYTSVENETSSTSSSVGNEEYHEELNLRSFYAFFIKSPGPPQIIFNCILFALAYGSTIGVVPSVMTDQFARVCHNFDHSDSCANYEPHEMPQACLDGSSDAQTSTVVSSFVSNMLTFISSSLIGSISDEYGRRHLLNSALFLNLFGPLCLVIVQSGSFSLMNPNMYYIANCMGGCISWVSLALSALSDVTPKKWRAPIFGVLLSGYSLGFALSPMLALGFNHYEVSVLSLSVLFGTFLFSLFFMPETLSHQAMQTARIHRQEQNERADDNTLFSNFTRLVARPFTELAILNRSCFFRLLSALAFFSGMSSSADRTLLVYYVENRLSFNDGDIAVMFVIIGVLGIIIQGAFLKPITYLVGERYVVVLSFICGAITNTLYAFAGEKLTIFLGVIFSCLGTMSFPTISAMKSNNVEEFEQGRIQGALYALSSLASATGPCLLRLTYQQTKDTNFPGGFFLVATTFFIVATLFGWALPKDKANSQRHGNRDTENPTNNSALSDGDGSIREPLLRDA